ncbi:MAG: preprotein translocase subunit SecE [Candidatus Dadabacteria bacterium]|nr:preprotein translocase subunit SecE [Candidatus Dadabacteria bacterium]
MGGYVRKAVQYFKDVEGEFWKISWPNRESTVKSTAIVLLVSVLFTVVIAVADYVFSNLIRLILV